MSVIDFKWNEVDTAKSVSGIATVALRAQDSELPETACDQKQTNGLGGWSGLQHSIPARACEAEVLHGGWAL